ncbi:hypothetical protein Ccrd_012992 [Cynara cardunculus var. scolymus]|uniref:Uncharacterized protein n=1 Tax=Cynara cardunculus var. scolymus TaxID=59895 RepID=A0A103YGE9_CYNCS|nr:hypothetical protein Ccrd_012992 [Cynara cardunculus var. scolymus]
MGLAKCKLSKGESGLCRVALGSELKYLQQFKRETKCLPMIKENAASSSGFSGIPTSTSFPWGVVLKTVTSAPKALAILTATWPSPPRPTTPTFTPVSEGAVSCDPSTEQWCTSIKRQILWPTEHKMLICNHVIRVPTVCACAIKAGGTISENLFPAVVFKVISAAFA